MAVTISGLGTVTGISAGGLPSGVVTVDTLASSLNLSSKTITLPSTAANKVLQTVQVYQSSTRVAYSGESNVALTGDYRYINSIKIGGSITKLSSTSYCLVIAHYSHWVNTTNLHDTYMWCAETSDYRHLGFDPYRMSGPQGSNKTGVTFMQTFTSGQTAGTKTFWLASGTGDSRTNTGVLNWNPETDGGNTDTANAPTTSQMIVMEIEP